jgi:hypothetical protein
MLPKNIYSSKYYSVSSVGMDRPEFTPLKRGKSLDEGGSHKWEEVVGIGL